MKKLVLCIMVIAVFAGCATMSLSPQERELVREFDAIDDLTVDDITFIEAFGFNPKRLTPAQKAFVMKEGKDLSAAIMFYQ